MLLVRSFLAVSPVNAGIWFFLGRPAGPVGREQDFILQSTGISLLSHKLILRSELGTFKTKNISLKKLPPLVKLDLYPDGRQRDLCR